MRNIFRCWQMLEEGWVGGGGRSPNPTLGSTLGFWAVPTRPWDEEEAMLMRGQKWGGESEEGKEERGGREEEEEKEGLPECMKVSVPQRRMIHMCWHRWLQDFGHQNNDCNFCREAIFCTKVERCGDSLDILIPGKNLLALSTITTITYTRIWFWKLFNVWEHQFTG